MILLSSCSGKFRFSLSSTTLCWFLPTVIDHLSLDPVAITPQTTMASCQVEPEQPRLYLPILVLHRICEFLCDHCEPQQLRDGTHSAAACRQGKMALKNLCQVSKTLRFVAEPVLYHYWKGTFAPNTRGADMFRRSSMRFLSRLHARPHLRRYVRVLNIRDRARDEYSYGPSFPFETDLDYEIDPILTGKGLSRIKGIAASAGIKCSSSDFSAQNFAESIAQIMLAMVPRLNELTLIAARSWDFRLLSC